MFSKDYGAMHEVTELLRAMEQAVRNWIHAYEIITIIV